jgi:hypothetical protein
VPARYPGDRDDASDAVRLLGGQPQRPRHGVTVRNDSAAADVGGVQHGQQVRDDLGRRMALRISRPV